jgi:hypothetical protein
MQVDGAATRPSTPNVQDALDYGDTRTPRNRLRTGMDEARRTSVARLRVGEVLNAVEPQHRAAHAIAHRSADHAVDTSGLEYHRSRAAAGAELFSKHLNYAARTVRVQELGIAIETRRAIGYQPVARHLIASPATDQSRPPTQLGHRCIAVQWKINDLLYNPASLRLPYCASWPPEYPNCV